MADVELGPHPTPRDLREVAQEYVANPSIGKRIRRSRALSPFRRGAHAPVSSIASAAAKGVAVGLGKIPVPVVNDLAVAAWGATVKALRSKSHTNKLGAPEISQKEKVKFSLKELGGSVGDWDRYRWKIAHAVEEVNKQVDACRAMEDAPCDLWVKLIAKRLYLQKRVAKLRVSVQAVMSVCQLTLDWLDSVDKDVVMNEVRTHALFQDDVQKLKTFAGAHMGCAEEFCMHSRAKWSMKRSVPTSDLALWLVKASGTVSSGLADEFDAVDSVDSALSD